MMKKETIGGVLKAASGLKDKATKMSKDAVKTAGTMKTLVEVGVSSSKTAVERASQLVNKETIATGIGATSKGMEIAAKGARIASQSVGVVADTMEKASSGMKSPQQEAPPKRLSCNAAHFV